MSKKWLKERRKDHYYKRAKQQEYRSRAAFKLMQMDDRFNIIRQNDMVIDLGANPGGWSQVAAELVGRGGKVIAIDIKPIKSIKGVVVLRGDARKEEVKSMVRESLEGKHANVILSDMSPNIRGNYSMDHACSIELAEFALEYAHEFLGRGGNMVVKVFDGDLTKHLFNNIKLNFKNVKRHSPKASRKSSSELYIIGKSFSPSSKRASPSASSALPSPSP